MTKISPKRLAYYQNLVEEERKRNPNSYAKFPIYLREHIDAMNSLDSVLKQASRLWTLRCEEYVKARGEQGGCVLGAGLQISVLEKRCKYPKKVLILEPNTPYQGGLVWEHSRNEIIQFIKDATGIVCTYKWGRLD